MSKTPAQTPLRSLLLRLVDEAYNKTAWHGPNLRGATRRISVAEAVWRPGAKRRNIVEIVVHCAYWKYAVRRRILGGKRGAFPLKGSNWFALPPLNEVAWREYQAMLDECHIALREAIVAAPLAALAEKTGPNAGPAAHVFGIALHDTYHAGQVRTIKSLYKQAGRRRG